MPCPPSPPCLPLHEGIHRAAMQWDQTLCSLHPDVQLTRGRLPRTCGVGGGGSGPGGAALPPSLRPPLTFRAGGDEFECQVEVSSVGEAVCGYGGLRWGGEGLWGAWGGEGAGRHGGMGWRGSRRERGYGELWGTEGAGLWGAMGWGGVRVLWGYGVGRRQDSMGLWGREGQRKSGVVGGVWGGEGRKQSYEGCAVGSKGMGDYGAQRGWGGSGRK